MNAAVPLLVIGAGPFGLAAGSYAAAHGIDCLVVGEPMAFWRYSMPRGLRLRSSCDWHLDPEAVHTIDEYLNTLGQSCSQVEPLSLELYLGYADWFLRQKALRPLRTTVRRLDRTNTGFAATLDTGSLIRAENVVIAVGLRYFAHVPIEIRSLLPPDSFVHTCDCIDLDRFREQRCLIVGGRQSAFEWAALLREAQAAAVHVCYRHETPAFERSDWSWVAPLVDRTRTDTGWYRRLTEGEKQAIGRRMWAEGRARLEPWLWPRIDHSSIHLWPHSRVTACARVSNSEYRVTLNAENVIDVHQIILATGYKVDIGRIPFLRRGNLWPGLRMRDGYPELDDWLQTSYEGLFFTGQAAVQDFGPFFGFTVAVVASAERIGQALLKGTNL